MATLPLPGICQIFLLEPLDDQQLERAFMTTSQTDG
jgi:hypothetical protein